MSQDVRPTTAISIILLAVCFLSMIFWARGESLSAGGPDQMQVNADGDLFIHIADKLYKLSPSLEFIDEYELTALGVYDLVGDFAFFSNGDILIRRGQYNPGLIESISRYLRKQQSTPPVAKHNNEGIYRCNLDSNECAPFGSKNLDFDSAFHLSIDVISDTVYVSDTGRHKLRKFDAQGNELAVIEDGYKFPNQNMLVNDELYVVDTNHHSIRVVETDTASFGNILESHSIVHPQLDKKIWPFSLATINNQWWVNSMAASMSHGTIAKYNENWEFIDRVALPVGADPIDFAVLQHQVIITDLQNIRIYQLNHDGELMNNSLPDEIVSKLALTQENQQYYKSLSNVFVGIFVIGLFFGIIVAIIQSRKESDPSTSMVSETLNINIDDPNIKWVDMNKQGVRTLKMLMFAPILFLLIMIFIWTLDDNQSISIVPFILVSFAIISMPIFIFKSLSYRIGTLSNVLIIKKSNHVYTAAKDDNILFSDTHIMIGQLSLLFLRPQPLFNTEQIVKEVMPLLKNATYIHPRKMNSLILKRQKPMVIGIVLMLVFVAFVLMLADNYS